MSDLFSYLGDLNGPEYDYLGHFRSMEYLCEGHNDTPNEDDALMLDKVVQEVNGGRLENAANTIPQGA